MIYEIVFPLAEEYRRQHRSEEDNKGSSNPGRNLCEEHELYTIRFKASPMTIINRKAPIMLGGSAPILTATIKTTNTIRYIGPMSLANTSSLFLSFLSSMLVLTSFWTRPFILILSYYRSLAVCLLLLRFISVSSSQPLSLLF